MKVARNEPATPSTMVRMKPVGLLGPGMISRARKPATIPTTKIQSMLRLPPSCDALQPKDATRLVGKDSGAAPQSPCGRHNDGDDEGRQSPATRRGTAMGFLDVLNG